MVSRLIFHNNYLFLSSWWNPYYISEEMQLNSTKYVIKLHILWLSLAKSLFLLSVFGSHNLFSSRHLQTLPFSFLLTPYLGEYCSSYCSARFPTIKQSTEYCNIESNVLNFKIKAKVYCIKDNAS